MTDDELREFVRAEIRRAPQRGGGVLHLADPGGGVRRIAFGVANLGGFGGGAGINGNIAHGLGVSPSAVYLTATECAIAGDGNAATNVAIGGYDATNITVRLRTPGYAASASAPNIHWIALA